MNITQTDWISRPKPFRFSHFCAPQINAAAVSCDLTRCGGEALYIGNRIRYNQSNIGGHWSPDMSAPQHIGVRAPTGRLSGVREQTCRLPSKLSLGSRQVGCLAFGSRPVGSPAYRRWGPDRSVPQKIGVGGPTCRLPRHCQRRNVLDFHFALATWHLQWQCRSLLQLRLICVCLNFQTQRPTHPLSHISLKLAQEGGGPQIQECAFRSKA